LVSAPGSLFDACGRPFPFTTFPFDLLFDIELINRHTGDL
jgi:hypothetical protein